MSRTNDEGSAWWFGLGVLLVAAFAAVLYIQSTLDRPSWSPRPSVQPAATALQHTEVSSARSATGEMADRGWWSVESSNAGLRLVYHR